MCILVAHSVEVVQSNGYMPTKPFSFAFALPLRSSSLPGEKKKRKEGKNDAYTPPENFSQMERIHIAKSTSHAPRPLARSSQKNSRSKNCCYKKYDLFISIGLVHVVEWVVTIEGDKGEEGGGLLKKRERLNDRSHPSTPQFYSRDLAPIFLLRKGRGI